jgi:hypothetical protein
MSGIFGSSGGGFPSFDFSALSGYYLAQSKLRAAQLAPTAPKASTAATNRPADAGLAPWDASKPPQSDTARLKQAMQTTSFVDLQNSAFDKPGVSGDSKKLFALFTGLTSLQALASKAADDKTLSGERDGLDRRFQSGIDQVKSLVTGQGFDALTLLFGSRAKKVDSELAIPRSGTIYSGNPIVQGASGNAITGLTGNEVFNVSIAKSTGTFDIQIDLSQIGGPPSVDNIVAYMNEQMKAAGVITRFTRDVFNGKTDTSPKSYGIAVESVATEKVSFSAPTTAPAVYVAGVAGASATQTAQLVKLTDQGTSVTTNFSAQIAPKTGTTDARGTAVDAQGNTYVVGTTTGDLGQGAVQGSQDVFLRKYDSAGQLVWSHLLGSSTSADGFGVAVDASGNVAIAGRVTDRLTTTATGGGSDSFVSKYDSQGNEVFTRQIAPVLDDQANALSFGADGSLYIAGQTKGSISSGTTSAGGTDAYLQKLTAKGTLVYTRQLGGSGDDRANAVSVDGDGNVVLATMESGAGIVRKFAPGDATSAAIWQVNLGDLGGGSIGGVALNGGAVYVSGTTTNADLTAGGQATVATPSSGGSDGFVMKIADAGQSASASFVSYIGTSGSDSAANVAVNNGDIYVAGATNGSLTGGAAPSVSNAYVAKFDDTGAQVWVHQYAGSAGTGAARSVAVDPQGGSVLDTLGLPRGTISFDQSRDVTAQSTVRAGDYFSVSVNGLDPHRITVEAGDTLRSLAARITGTLALKGSATVTHGSAGDELTIQANAGSVIELKRGDKSFDALAGLGIEPGKLYNTTSAQATGATAKDKIVFALGLTPTMSLGTQSQARLVVNSVNQALSAIRGAYQALTSPPSSTTTPKPSTTSTALPADVQRQLANYQAALAIFGGSTG